MFAVYLYLLALGSIVRKFWGAALAITFVLTLGAGLVTYLSGGNAISGMLWAGGISFAASAGTALLASFGALFRRW